MRLSATSFRPMLLKSIRRVFTMVSASPKAAAGVEDAPTGFYTIDGRLVAYTSGASAVSAGKGMFVGGYFVGAADEFVPAGQDMPFIRY